MALIFGIVSGLLLWAYLRLAPGWQQIDVPQARSSHTRPTVRGAGAVLLPLVAVAWGLGYLPGWPAIGVLFAGLTGLAADHEYMPPWTRLLLYALAWVFIGAGYAGFGFEAWWWLPLWLAALAWVNLFNFMDGINGMLTGYSLVLLLALYLHPALADHRQLIGVATAWVVTYGFFNVRRRALLFAGDIGAIALACILGLLLLLLLGRTGQWWYLLWVAVYAADAGGTLVWRILHRHHLFTPHRNHLYQYLANEAGWPALAVSGLYAGLQLSIILVLHLAHQACPQHMHILALALLACMALVYVAARWRMHQYILKRNPTMAASPL